MALVIVGSRQGRETSFGNAGIIQVEAAEPYPLPRDIATQVRIGLGRTNDVSGGPADFLAWRRR